MDRGGPAYEAGVQRVLERRGQTILDARLVEAPSRTVTPDRWRLSADAQILLTKPANCM